MVEMADVRMMKMIPCNLWKNGKRRQVNKSRRWVFGCEDKNTLTEFLYLCGKGGGDVVTEFVRINGDGWTIR